MRNAFVDYFRCPVEFAAFDTAEGLSASQGYFRLGEATCYGRPAGEPASKHFSDDLRDVSEFASRGCGRLRLPFDLAEVVDNLRLERYRLNSDGESTSVTSGSVARYAYYTVRPLLPVVLRKHLQRIRLTGWDKIAFPRWPVDCTVERLFEEIAGLILTYTGAPGFPFIWFWPEGLSSCAIMTHDVEASAGRDFCQRLMDLDDSHRIKASFQIVPEDRYEDPHDLVAAVRSRGFEANIHDLNHDGRLFESREEFLRRVKRINEYAGRFQSRGFRSGAMYRRQEWFAALECSYDMSVPSVAHLEPQRGGCCTVTPYFIGEILELPLTTIQDYSLFNILNDYSITLWREQIDLIMARNGLISFNTHPDYLNTRRARVVYTGLLELLSTLRDERRLWVALAGDVERWWRHRDRMSLVPDGDSWRIEGPDAERARVAYASLTDSRVVYKICRAS